MPLVSGGRNETAKGQVMRIEPRDMTTIDEAAGVAAMAAVVSATPVVLEFNGIDVPVDRGASAGDICDEYYRRSRRREKESEDAAKQAKAAEIARAIVEFQSMQKVQHLSGAGSGYHAMCPETDLARVIVRYL